MAEQRTEITDLNLATYIKTVKQIQSTEHFLRGKQLVMLFPINREDCKTYHTEYINSAFALYDANKRNYTQILRALQKEAANS